LPDERVLHAYTIGKSWIEELFRLANVPAETSTNGSGRASSMAMLPSLTRVPGMGKRGGGIEASTARPDVGCATGSCTFVVVKGALSTREGKWPCVPRSFAPLNDSSRWRR